MRRRLLVGLGIVLVLLVGQLLPPTRLVMVGEGVMVILLGGYLISLLRRPRRGRLQNES